MGIPPRGSRALLALVPAPGGTNTPAKERSRQLEVVCIQFIFGLVTAQPWRKHSRKSPKLSGSLITELGLCRVRNKEAQHKRGLEGLSFERVYWTITEESLD